MKSKPEIPDEEIRSYMDFDQLMRKHEALTVSRNKYNFLNKILFVSFAVITISLILYYYNINNNNDKTQSINDIPLTQPSDNSQNSNAQEKQADQLNSPDLGVDSPKIKLKTNIEELVNAASVKDQIPPIIEREEPQADVEYNFIEAEPVDGYPHLYEYFNHELKYPDEGLQDSIQGVVTVSLVISETGQPEKIEIKNSLGEPFDREVKKVIENMPAWRPASVNGKPVSSRLSIPLTFQIKKIKRAENQ